MECSSPGFTYKCSVKDSERIGQSRNAERALEYVCITELARAGGHQSCRVSREFAGPCIGHARLIDISRPADQSAVVPGTTASGEAADAKAGAPKPAGQEPPQTLEALARDTVSKSQQQLSETDQKMKNAAKSAGAEIEKAGNAVGDAVKKSVGCLVTLFTKC